MEEKSKAEAGRDMPPPYTAGYGPQAPPVYMVDPPRNTVSNQQMGVGFQVTTSSSPYPQQPPYVAQTTAAGKLG